MTDILLKAIENVREKLHAATENAGYNLQCEEVQRINARLDKLVCHFMKLQKMK